jgi:hypothetical protein
MMLGTFRLTRRNKRPSTSIEDVASPDRDRAVAVTDTIERSGGVGERLKPAVLKTVRPQKGLVGSNPTPSATQSALIYTVERNG